MSGPSWVPPRLAHLRRDRRGLPVPYVNLWGPQHDGRWSVRPDPLLGGRDAAFMDDEGETEPDFTHQNIGRQRECVIRGLCQVCGRPVPWSRRYLVYSEISAARVDVEGVEREVISEPWLDGFCAQIALERCPALIRRRNAEGLVMVEVSSQREVELSISSGWLEGPLEAQTKAAPVAMWAKVVLPVRARRGV